MSTGSTPLRKTKWKALTSCRYKFNYDGAVFRDKDETGLGVVVEAVEALAAKGAIQFALEIGIMEDEFEGDSETIVKALKDVCPSHTTFGLIIEDVRALSSNLEKCHKQQISQQADVDHRVKNPSAADQTCREDAMGASSSPRLSGMQKQVLSLYRGFLRAARSKSSEDRCKVESFVSAEFRRNSKQVDRKNFVYIEYLLRLGKKQLDQLKSPDTIALSTLNVTVSETINPKP
ncbi:succinate dehydrogenase assembly factor 1, mitochondrial-like [Fagus crenata]